MSADLRHLVLSLSSCAFASVAACAHAPASSSVCARWVDSPQVAARAGALFVAVGSVPAGTPQADDLARRHALASLSDQVRVHVESSLHSWESATTRDGVATDNLDISATTQSRSELIVEGAEVIERCESGGTLHVLVAVDRARYAALAAERIYRGLEDHGKLAARAQQVEVANPLEASLAWRRAALVTVRLDELAELRALVGREVTPRTWPRHSELRQRALAAAARASVAVELSPLEDAATLQQAALSCLGAVGVPVTTGSRPPDATVKLSLTHEAFAPDAGLHVVRAHLFASLVSPSGTTLASTVGAPVKGMGLTPPAARADAARRLASTSLALTLANLLTEAGWDAPSCAAQ